MANKRYHVDLTDQEREELIKLTSRQNMESSLVKRAFILLAADRKGQLNWKDEQIVEAYGMRVRTVERLRERFVLEGFEIALKGKKRKIYKEKVFTGDVEAKLIALRCSEVPEGYNKWTFRLLSDKMVELKYVDSISHESCRQIFKKTKLSLGKQKVG